MTTEQLSGRELDVAIARAMGWELLQMGAGMMEFTVDREWVTEGDWVHPTNDGIDKIPAYSSSVDALIAGPEAKLREAGLRGPDLQWSAGPVTAIWWHLESGPHGATAPDEATARARAALQALTALAAIEKEVK